MDDDWDITFQSIDIETHLETKDWTFEDVRSKSGKLLRFLMIFNANLGNINVLFFDDL